MASIRHRITAKGDVTWQVRYRDAEGIARSDTFDDRTDAEKFKRLVEELGHVEAKAILDAREGSSDRVPTVQAWCAQHVDHLTGVTDGTRDRYRRIIATKLGALGHLPLDAVTPASIAKWVNAFERTGLSGKTIANHHGFLSAALKQAVRAGHMPSNPCEGTRIPVTERDDMIALTYAEFDTLLMHVRADARDMVRVMPLTGLRWGELTALQVRDVDLAAGTLSVKRAFKYTENSELVLGPPKTKASRRTIYLPQQALDVMARGMEGKGKEEYVFTNLAGSPWRRSRFHEGVWQPATRAALPTIGKKPRVHDMRHTCASWLLKQGSSMYTVQKYLGHESYSTTANVYAHMEPAEMRLAAAAMTAAMARPEAPLLEP